jgi:phage terminase large subunit GpA-like protein
MIDFLKSAVINSLQPPNLQPVSDWANENRMLSPEASATPGRFSMNVTPFMREPTDAMGDPHVPEVRVMKSSQIAYSENLNNVMFRNMVQNPGPMIMMQPTLEMAESYSKDRISTGLRDSPQLAALIDEKNKMSGNTILQKNFPGGLLRLVGGNSPASLASRPARDVFIDEEDRTAKNAGKEGDPEKLLKRRQTTFYDAKLVVGGTPVIKGISKTEKGFEKGDKRLYMVECPCCGVHIDLDWKQFQKKPERDNYGEYQCQKCGDWIKEKYKPRMVKDLIAGGTAYWEPTKGELPAVETHLWDSERGVYFQEVETVRSYYIWSAYSPFISWLDLCDEYNDAKDDPDLLQTFYNTLVGLPYEYVTHDLDDTELFKRRESWSLDKLPNGILALTAGVDAQDNRFEYTILGWGRHEEPYVLDFATVEGDPADAETRATLVHRLDEWSCTTESGRRLRIRSWFVDSGGHRGDAVYSMVKGRRAQKIFACKGLSTAGNPIFAGFSDQKAAKIRLARVGTDTAKEQIFAKLAKGVDEKGRVHFSDTLPMSYFTGLISEERTVKLIAGQFVVKYVKKHANIRNEPLDCFVYAYSALRSLKLNLDRKTSRRMILAQRSAANRARESEEEKEGSESVDAPTEETQIEESEKPPKPKRRGKKVKMSRGPRSRGR